MGEGGRLDWWPEPLVARPGARHRNLGTAVLLGAPPPRAPAPWAALAGVGPPARVVDADPLVGGDALARAVVDPAGRTVWYCIPHGACLDREVSSPDPAPTPTAGRLEGRVALVTGGARGIGRAIVGRLVAEGAAAVAILDVDGDGARATAAELGRPGAAVAAFPVELADADAVGPAVAAALAWTDQRLDVLVNNAGVFAKAPLRAVTVAEWDRIQAVNCRAPFLTLQAAAPALERSGRGRVVNVASMAARRGTPGEAAYAASKAGLVALTRVAALELGPCGVTVNAVCPGYVLTELGAETRSAADVDRWSAQSPLGRLATVDDVAGVVAFLASDDGAYLTGQALDVSGGMVML